MTTYTDEYIEHWARVFAHHKARKTLGITFEQFLRAPRECCHAASVVLSVQSAGERIRSAECAPLLPAQQHVAERISHAA
jgi:hypothetical protein